MSKEALKEDVKPAAEASTVDATKTQEVVKEVEENYEPDHKIPYKVFQAKNEKLRETERELKATKANMEKMVKEELYKREADIRRELEARMVPKVEEPEFTYEDQGSKDVKAIVAELTSVKQQLNDVHTTIEQARIKETLEGLKQEYPELSVDHVLALKRASDLQKRGWDWEECAKHSHDYFKAELDKRWKGMVESKKQAATKKVVGAEGLRNMKPEDRPKTWAQAAAMMAKHLGDD